MGHLLNFFYQEHDEQLSSTKIWGFWHTCGSPHRPAWLSGDVSYRCCVLTVPDSAGEVVEAAGTWACQCLPFLEAHAGSFRLFLRGTDFLFEGVGLVPLPWGLQRRERERLGLCISWQGKKDTTLCCSLEGQSIFRLQLS